ncbi:hypothetical protein V9L20_02345 [Variovorax sp. CCNWLW225]|uniref:hypothetical protein n=1 Tax=Variovorax sp. CCNWLW225 TaxID=3127462 RepID=UPI003076F7D6
MRKLLDANNSELSSVLDQLLRDNIAVTVREVARRHSLLKNASAFTRNESRKSLIEHAQRQQREASAAAEQVSSRSTSERLSERTKRVKHLEDQVRHLVAAHAALIRSVQLAGGTAALERFWREYKSVGDSLKDLGAVPNVGRVVRLPIESRIDSKDR